LNCAYSKTRAIGNRQTYLQMTPILLVSLAEKIGETRTQPRTHRKDQDQADIEGEVVVPTDEQHDRHSYRLLL